MTYVQTLKRIRDDKTNYRKRAAILIGRHSFVTVKISDQNVAAQVLKPTLTGDIVIASAHSRELQKQGWKGALNNLPACYLTGMLVATKALQKEVRNAVLYVGKDHFTSRVAACMKGIVDGGVSMPISDDSFPEQDRIAGQHIAKYASTLKDNQEAYNSRFSAILKNGLSPENYPSHFQEIKTKLSSTTQEKRPPAKAAEEEVTARPHKEKKKKEAPAKDDKTSKQKKEAKKKEPKDKKKAKRGKTKKK